MKKSTAPFLLAVLALLPGGSAFGQIHSDLWGANGEKWTPTGRLPDFSFAGYHQGEDPLPRVKAVTDVTRFGAKGDGKTDCTEAFRRAIEATEKGAILIPASISLHTGTSQPSVSCPVEIPD